jgi:hypothetical protein
VELVALDATNKHLLHGLLWLWCNTLLLQLGLSLLGLLGTTAANDESETDQQQADEQTGGHCSAHNAPSFSLSSRSEIPGS